MHGSPRRIRLSDVASGPLGPTIKWGPIMFGLLFVAILLLVAYHDHIFNYSVLQYVGLVHIYVGAGLGFYVAIATLRLFAYHR